MRGDPPADYYAAFLDLRGRPCFVIGAGEVGQRKTEGLLAAGAQVTVISPGATAKVSRLAEAGAICWLQRAYRPGDLDGAFLVIGATGDPSTNRELFAEAEARGRLCNIVDVPELCNFILPAIVRRGAVQVAVSTGGASPTLAQRIRDGISDNLGDEFGRLAELLRELRPAVLARYPDEAARREIWGRAVDSDALDLLRAGRVAEARSALERAMEPETTCKSS